MGNSNRGNSFSSDIAYHDYLVLFCFMDAEWSRRRPVYKERSDVKLFIHEPEHFTTKCCEYRNKVNDNYKKFSVANNLERVEPLAPYLFNPVHFIPFGHADDLFIVLLDDFDPIQYVTSEVRTTVEEVCLGFCPKLVSFCEPKPRSTFCELHTLLGPDPRLPMKAKDDRLRYSPALHEFQEMTPLLVFTKYKMHGLAAVGQGLLFQQALFKAMTSKIEDTKVLIRHRLALKDTVSTLMEKEDIDTLKCCFLDLQGSEEIATLMFCRNYSVAMTVVLALRSLTFSDVFKTDVGGKLKSALSACKAHRSIIWLNRKLRKEEPSSDISLFGDLHVFRWTHTSLAVSPNALFNHDHPNCHGYVEALSGLQISPGHCLEVEKGVVVTPKKQNGISSKENMGANEYHRCLLGTEDMIFSYASTAKRSQFPLLPLTSVLSLVTHNLYRFGCKRTRKDHGRDVIESVTTLVIPVPKVVENISGKQVDLICGEIRRGHFSALADLLPLIQRRLCYYGDMLNDERKGLGPQPGRLDLTKLKNLPRRYGVPISLRRTIEHLYQGFATLIADPFLFDSVLDLYDTFATFHAVLTDHLPHFRSFEPRSASGDSLGFLDEERVEQLSLLVEAIGNALMHRVLKTYPEAQIRDLGIDFRGGLNQILLAADAPLKCGLGLLRKYAVGINKEARRDTVGGLTRIGFMPGARCHVLTFGVEEKARLAFFEVDVPHVLDVDSYCESLHESFHLIFDALRLKHKSDSQLFALPADSVMGERLSEVFATLLCQMFLFGSDTETFLYDQLCSYSKSLSSVGWDDCEVVVRFTELLIRLFLVVDAIPKGKNLQYWDDTWIREGVDINTPLERFQAMVNTYGPFFSEYERLWNGDKGNDVKSFCWKQFNEIYPKASRFMPRIWLESIRLYKRFATAELCWEDGSYKYDDHDIRESIEQSLDRGRPLIRSLCQNHRNHSRDDSGGNSSKDTQDAGLDALILVCAVLRHHIQTIRKARGKAIHLQRRSSDKVVEYPQGRPWYEFQVDKESASMFCPVPSARRRRLREQIVVLKTFWDISSNLRERRLWEIISDNWPEAELPARG